MPKPKNAIEGPILVGFCDGSLSAYAANIYLRWKMSEADENGNLYSVQLLCAKAKVTPLNGCTVPKSELNAATLLSRLAKSATKALKADFPSKVICASDSQCVIRSLDMPTSKFKPYFHNRLSEIKNNMEDISEICKVEKFRYIPSKMNPADLATRTNGKLADIDINSEWQSPSFLKQDISSWPMTREFGMNTLPEEELRKKSLVTFLAVKINPVKSKLWSVVEHFCNYSEKWEKVLRMIARVLRGTNIDFSKFRTENMIEHVESYLKSKNDSTKKAKAKWNVVSTNSAQEPRELVDAIELIGAEVSQEEIDIAEHLVMLFAMDTTKEEMENDKLNSLLPFEKDGIIYTRGRVGGEALERILGVDKLPILSHKSRVARLIMIRAHEEGTGLDHRGVAGTLAKSRTRAWITQGAKLAKSVRNSCNHCKRRSRILQTQQMADIRDEQLQPCPPFTHVSLDYMGPLSMYDEIKKRVSMKVWVLVYCCRSTRAVCLLAVPGYSTDKFLVRHSEFVFRFGNPQTIVSDRGTSLVKAGMVLEADSHPKTWNWKKVVEANKTTNWEFTAVGCQWRNGLSEAMVKITKKCLEVAIPEGAKISYGELITLLAQVSYTINCRPVGIFGGSDLNDEMQPITPNQLLIGRSDFDVKPPEYDVDIALPKRAAYVKNLVDKWWSSWIKQVFPHLIPCKRWRTAVRNLEVGDVCLLFYPGSMSGKYKLVRVVEVHPDKRGLVRTVSIIYKKKVPKEKLDHISQKAMVKEKVGVQRLIVIQPASVQNQVVTNTSSKTSD